MCWQCDHPGSTYEEYLEHFRGLIRRHGWAVQGIEGDGIHPPWAYTVGLTGYGEPELVMTGLQPGITTELLNSAAAHVLRPHTPRPRPGDQMLPSDGPLIEIVRVTEPSAHLRVAVDIYSPSIRALQLVHADDQGRWPWEPGWRGIRGGQPVLGIREPFPPRSLATGTPETSHDVAIREASRYLEDRGFSVLDHDWHQPDGDLDIVAVEGHSLVVCEVRTRSGTRYGAPLETVSQTKHVRLRTLAAAWMNAHDTCFDHVRIDVIGLLSEGRGGFTIEHVRGCLR